MTFRLVAVEPLEVETRGGYNRRPLGLATSGTPQLASLRSTGGFGPGFASTVTCKWIWLYVASPGQRPEAQRPDDMGGASVRLARVSQVCQLRELGGTQP